MDKNRERENLVLKFFEFSLSSLSSLSLSLTSRNPLFFIHPHRILPLPADLVSGEVSSVKLELRRPSPASGPALSTVEQLRRATRTTAVFTSVAAPVTPPSPPTSFCSKAVRGAPKRVDPRQKASKNCCTKIATLNPLHLLCAPPSLHDGAANHLG